MPNYGDKQYWDKRYKDQQEKTFDWLQNYDALKPIISKIATKDSKILMLGCGNSTLSEDMYKDGYEDIYNIDISPIVIEQMSRRNSLLVNMKYEVMDAMNLTYPDNYFDLVIDKSTIDAILCSEDSFINTARMTKEIQKVLKVDGRYFIVSYGAPENRTIHLTRKHLSWTLDYFPFESNTRGPATHYGYITKKNKDADMTCKENWNEVEAYLLIEEQKEKMIRGNAKAKGIFSESETQAKIMGKNEIFSLHIRSRPRVEAKSNVISEVKLYYEC